MVRSAHLCFNLLVEWGCLSCHWESAAFQPPHPLLHAQACLQTSCSLIHLFLSLDFFPLICRWSPPAHPTQTPVRIRPCPPSPLMFAHISSKRKPPDQDAGEFVCNGLLAWYPVNLTEWEMHIEQWWGNVMFSRAALLLSWPLWPVFFWTLYFNLFYFHFNSDKLFYVYLKMYNIII